MKDNAYIVDGYEFESIAAYEEAKAEAEKIRYIRANTDLRDEKALQKLYEEYTDNPEEPMRTAVGVGFLREVQRRVARDENFRKNMKAIPVSSRNSVAEFSNIKAGEIQDRFNAFKKQSKKTGTVKNIIIVFLCLLVGILFAFELRSNTQNDIDAERERILNEYAGWADELTEKENELKAYEKQLKEREVQNGQD